MHSTLQPGSSAQIPGGMEVLGPIIVVLLVVGAYIAYQLYRAFTNDTEP